MFDELNALLGANDVSAAINAGLGINVDSFQANEVTLVSILVDDSSSIEFGRNTQAVMDGYNGVIDALMGSKGAGTVLWHGRLLNGQVICPFVMLKDAVKLTPTTYVPNGGTPLYERAIEFLGTVTTKIKEFQDAGVVVKSISLIITDGANNGRRTPAEVKKIVDALVRSETSQVHGMGVDDGETDFTAVFASMGIDGKHVMLPGSSAKDIRAACQMFSQSAIRVSQTAGGLGALAN